MSQEQPKEYEILYFVSITLEDDEIKNIKTKINDILTKHQGTIIKEDNLGKHKLAYAIKRARHGYFLLNNFSAPATEISSINHELKLMPEILRYKLTIKQKNTTAAAQSKLKPETGKSTNPILEEQKNLAPEKKTTETENDNNEKNNEKVDTQELNRKIDELLADDNI